jgi:hypothetical protein
MAKASGHLGQNQLQPGKLQKMIFEYGLGELTD